MLFIQLLIYSFIMKTEWFLVSHTIVDNTFLMHYFAITKLNNNKFLLKQIAIGGKYKTKEVIINYSFISKAPFTIHELNFASYLNITFVWMLQSPLFIFISIILPWKMKYNSYYITRICVVLSVYSRSKERQ